MTEEEAKTKWCPMARVDLSDGQESKDGYPVTFAMAGVNRLDGNLPIKGSLCLASGCMMWRWNEQVAKLKYPQDAKDTAGRWDQSIIKTYPNEYELAERTGYCGLAGNEG